MKSLKRHINQVKRRLRQVARNSRMLNEDGKLHCSKCGTTQPFEVEDNSANYGAPAGTYIEIVGWTGENNKDWICNECVLAEINGEVEVAE